jgi:hypothetical protein
MGCSCLTATQASIPIRHGGRLASRVSSCPRDHFCRSMIALARDLRTILPSRTLARQLGLWLFRGKRPGRIALGSADT